MVSIPKAFHSLEKREMTVSDYDTYLRMHPYQSSVKAIKCIECGDILTYCKGEKNKPYFKHSPTHEGHGYCSLYHEGTESKTNESLIRKKLFQEEDISLNYELLYKDGKWSNMITIPPFNDSEIRQNERNNTIISVGDCRERIELSIDSAHFQPGQIRKIKLNDFKSKVRIGIKGNSTKQNLSYDMDGFMPSTQMYSSLIIQSYIPNSETKYIDLIQIKYFVCKKISGRVYTGRHYFVFSNNISFVSKYANSKSIEIKKINLLADKNFNYHLYDIVFTEIDNDSKTFCDMRNCELIQKDDAVILWPPIKTIGNYKYYPNRQTKMFISFQNESNALDMAKYDTDNEAHLFFKVKNINSNSFYVTLDKREMACKEPAVILTKNEIPQNINRFTKAYHLNDGVFLQAYDSGIKLGRKSGLLCLDNQLERIFYQEELSFDTNEKKLLTAIRYSREFVILQDKYYQYLSNKYKDNRFITEYLEYCNVVKKIKKKALEILFEGV